MKKVIPINDGWRFRLGFDKACLDKGAFEGFKNVELPHNSIELKTEYFEPNDMRAVSTYVRELVVPESYNGCRLLLRFDGADNYAEVYVNGMFVTSHKGGTPFTADVTAPIKFDYRNIVVVKLDARVKKDVPGAGKGNLLQYGVCRKINLVIESGGIIRDAAVTAAASAELSIDVLLADFYPETAVDAYITDWNGETVGRLGAKSVLGERVRLTGSVERHELWSPDNPAVYTAHVRLISGSKPIDEYTTDFAFRTAAFYRDGFRLNGNKIKLIGLNRIDSYPGIGRAAPDTLEKSDARLIKSLGCNCVRTLGLAARSFIEECDRIGLMVIEDFGGDGYIGDTRWKSAMVDIIAETVIRDRNSPSVIAWGVRANNSPDCDELYFKTAKCAKDLDPSRAVLGARSFMGSRLYEDVFGFNETRKTGVSRPRKTAQLFIPYLITEHSGAWQVKNFDPVADRRAHALAHLDVLDKVLGSKSIDGCIGMSLSDFHTARHKGSGDSVWHSGVTDMYRNLKPAAYAYMSQAELQLVLYPVEPLYNDEFDGRLTVFTNCDSVRLYRGESLVGEYFPDRKRYKHLRHPPVFIDDFIGGLLIDEGMTPFFERLCKRLFQKIRRKGMTGLSFWDKLAVRMVSRSIKTDGEGFKRLADKYLYALVSYRLEGVRGGEVVSTRAVGYFPQSGNGQTVAVECAFPEIAGAYEMVKVSVTATDGNGMTLAYENSPVRVAASGSVSLVGPELRNFSGGSIGFYIKSVQEGLGKITVWSRWGKNEYDLEVRYASVEKL